LKDFQPWKDLLSTVGVLTPEEADLFQKFYNYFSNVGSHRLGADMNPATLLQSFHKAVTHETPCIHGDPLNSRGGLRRRRVRRGKSASQRGQQEAAAVHHSIT
jgi:hypothetical protein